MSRPSTACDSERNAAIYKPQQQHNAYLQSVTESMKITHSNMIHVCFASCY